jgi:ELWxxDGT repeat protein
MRLFPARLLPAITIAAACVMAGSSLALASGSAMLKDIRKGAGASEPRDWATVNGTTLFTADDGKHGIELWTTDGSRAGTHMLVDVNPSGGGASGASVIPLRDSFSLVLLDDGAHGLELWRTDGTAAGTRPVKDIRSGKSSSNIAFWASPVRGLAFFFADDGQHGRELWRSDGTRSGTFLLKDVYPGPTGQDGLTTVRRAGGYAWMNASDPNHGRELWRSDGTTAGTKRVADLNPGPADSDPSFPTILNGKAYFTADNGTNGYALHRSRGPGDVQMVKDIWPQPSGIHDYPGSILSLTRAGSLIYFVGTNGPDNGPQLWKTDGTNNGTEVVRFIGVGPEGARPYLLTGFRNRLYFVARPGTTPGGTSLWRTDGQMANTVEVKVLSNANQAVKNCQPAITGGHLFFPVHDNNFGTELWTSDGTTDGTRRLTDTNPGQNDGAIGCPEAGGPNVYIFARGTGNVPEWWRSNGTPGGTTRIARFTGFRSVGDPEYIRNGMVFSDMDDGTHGEEPWVYRP